jgi:hypothetical protein
MCVNCEEGGSMMIGGSILMYRSMLIAENLLFAGVESVL